MTMHSETDPEVGLPDDRAEAGPEGLTPLVADLRRLGDEARTLAEAELAYQASRARVAANAASKIALFGLGALALVFLAVMALVFGAVLALATLVGPLAATAIVAGLFVLGALACALLVRARIRRTLALILPRTDRP